MITHSDWNIPERIEFVQDGKIGVKSKVGNGSLHNGNEHSLKHFKASVQSSSETNSKSGYYGSWITPCYSTSLEWKRVFRTGRGLRNLGNTCFLNASLQSLLHCPPFATALLEKLFSAVSNCQSHSGYCSICAVEKTALSIFSSDSSFQSYSPVELVRNLKVLSRNFTPGRQADAHEFIRFLLDDMNRILLGLPKGKLCHDRQQEMHTLVHEIFGGCYESKVSCESCGSSSNTFEPFLDVSLDLEGVNTITKALKGFITPERLFGRNRYFCSYCKQKTDAFKVFQFRRIPNVFIFHLKRFRFTKKETKFVSYYETLDFSSFLPLENDSISNPIYYRLCAVVVHEGFSVHGGHYYAYVRNSNGIWYLKDDECTREVGVQTVLQQRAYLLFYSRVAQEKNNNLKVEKMKDTCAELQLLTKPLNAKEEGKLKEGLEMNSNLQSNCKHTEHAFQTYEISLIRFLRLQMEMQKLHGMIGHHLTNVLNTSFHAQMSRKIFVWNNTASALQGIHYAKLEQKENGIQRIRLQESKKKQRLEEMPSPFSVGSWNNSSVLLESRKELFSREDGQPPFVKKRDLWDVDYDKGKQRKRRKRQNTRQNFSKQMTNNGSHASR